MARRLFPRLCRVACETERKLNGLAATFRLRRWGYVGQVAGARLRPAWKAGHYVLFVLFVLLLVLVVPTRAFAQPERPPATAGKTRAAEGQATPEKPAAGEAQTEGAEDVEHREGLLPVVARLVNFAILVGTLVYLLRSPLMAYLNERGTQIRSDLVNAAEMKRTAAAQLEEIDRRMTALPGELEALRAQGAQEIAAEEIRIRAAAAAERDRLLEQARREIDQHVK